MAKKDEKHLVVSTETHAEVRRLSKLEGVTTDKTIRLMIEAFKAQKGH